MPQRDVPREVRAPSTSAELQEIQERAVERAILDKRRHQYLQEYPGGPIDRYLPPSDPYAFLIEAEKLTPQERRWQVFFVVLPWVVFFFMAALPLGICLTQLPRIEAAGKLRREADLLREAQQAAVPPFGAVTFADLLTLAERPVVTLIVLGSPTYAMQTLRPVLADLDFLFRLHGLRVRIVEASLADAPADMVAGGYSPALGPFLQICIPYAADGDSGVVDFDGPLRPSDIAATLERACSGQPVDWPALRAATAALDSRQGELVDELFGLHFVDERPAPRRSWWRRQAPDSTAVPDRLQRDLLAVNGVEAALEIVREHRAQTRAMAL